MIQKTLVLNDPIGFHARTASLFAKTASSFEAEVLVYFNDKKANGKSMLSLMTLGVKSKQEIRIKVSGRDEEMALDRLSNLVTSNFNAH
jgi:phosphocarrier protein HPr